MKKLSKKTYKILGITIAIIALTMLICSTWLLVKKIKSQKTTETTVSMQDYSDEADEEGIDIEDLEEYIPEENNNETNSKTSTESKSNKAGTSTGNKYYIKVNYGLFYWYSNAKIRNIFYKK